MKERKLTDTGLVRVFTEYNDKRLYVFCGASRVGKSILKQRGITKESPTGVWWFEFGPETKRVQMKPITKKRKQKRAS